MRAGITYRNKHSSEFCTIVKTVGRPIIAPVRQKDEEVPNRDGNIDCSESGGRLFYDDKVLELEFLLVTPNDVELHKQATRFINWISGGYSELIFDDMPYTAWIAKPADLDKLAIELYKNSKIKIQFRCRPFNKFLFDSDGIPLDSDVVLDSDIPIGLGDENEIEFSAGSSSHTLDYLGSAPVRPILHVSLEPTVQQFIMTANGVTLTITPINSSVIDRVYIIDCENGDMPEEVIGDFCEISPEENTINIQSIGGAGNVFFEYRHNFIYGEDIIT